MLHQILSWISVSSPIIFRTILTNWLTVGLSVFAAFNFRLVAAFVKRAIKKTDKLILGDWQIYRYTVSHGQPKFIVDTWTIRRTIFSRNYVVDVAVSTGSNRPHKSIGKLIYNERDRFSILFEGVDRKEHSLISFCPRITIDGDSRMLGLGHGDDTDYVLSARPYLASKAPLDESLAQQVLDQSIKSMREGTGPTIQFPSHVMNKVFSDHPLPVSAPPLGNARRRFFDWVLHVTRYLRR